MTSVWRIGHCTDPTQPAHRILAEQGLGATRYSGRWHTMSDRPVVYAAASRALCQLEKRVHANGFQLKGQVLMRLDLPDGAALQAVEDRGLPPQWRTDVGLTRRIGDRWLAQGGALGLWVPSAVEPLERNLLINAAHAGFRRIRLAVERAPFQFDERLL